MFPPHFDGALRTSSAADWFAKDIGDRIHENTASPRWRAPILPMKGSRYV